MAKNKFNDMELVRQGTQIILPEDLDLAEAIRWLQAKHQQDNTDVAIHESLEGIHVLDGAVALHKAMKKLFGWINIPPGFFGPSATLLTVKVGPGILDTIQVPWGQMSVPNIRGYLQPHFNAKAGYPNFAVAGVVKQGDRNKVKALLDEVRSIVATDSIYRNKAVRVDFSYQRDGEDFDIEQHAPKFIDVSTYGRHSLILPDLAERQVNVNLLSFLEQKEKMRAARIPLKRNVLLFGTYGTGKTLTANVAASIAVKNGWTFLYLSDVRDLADAIRMACQFQPCVIFAEDLDRDLSGQRTSQMDEALNTIDGFDMKDKEIFVVLTSNDVTKLNPAMLRPGRLDAIIEIPPHDAKSALRLVKMYGGDFLDPTDSMTGLGEALNGMIPASIREVVERSKAAAVLDSNDGHIVHHVKGKHLLLAAESLKTHLKLMADNAERLEQATDPYSKLGGAAGAALGAAICNAAAKHAGERREFNAKFDVSKAMLDVT